MSHAETNAERRPQAQPQTIDLTPTWGEVGNIVKMFVRSRETKAVMAYWPEVARAFASAEALSKLLPTLTEDQRKAVAAVMVAELTKQGVADAKT